MGICVRSIPFSVSLLFFISLSLYLFTIFSFSLTSIILSISLSYFFSDHSFFLSISYIFSLSFLHSFSYRSDTWMSTDCWWSRGNQRVLPACPPPYQSSPPRSRPPRPWACHPGDPGYSPSSEQAPAIAPTNTPLVPTSPCFHFQSPVCMLNVVTGMFTVRV